MDYPRPPRLVACTLCIACVLAPASSPAQGVSDADLQKRANAILTLMGFSLVPDVTTGALSLSDQGAGDEAGASTHAMHSVQATRRGGRG